MDGLSLSFHDYRIMWDHQKPAPRLLYADDVMNAAEGKGELKYGFFAVATQ